MRIAFEVAGVPVDFSRSAFWGTSELRVGKQVVPLNRATDLSTHIELALTKTWRHEILGHEVVIEKFRPLLFAGLRPQTYRVIIDGQVVIERCGY